MGDCTRIQLSQDSTSRSVSSSRKLERAVYYINAKSNEAARALIEIGKYLIAEFYDNDIDKVKSRAPRKEASLRKLAEHPMINLSYSTLNHAVRLAEQERRYFSHNYYFADLTESHKIVLLSLEESHEKLHYAKLVIKDKLSVRALKQQLVNDGVMGKRGRRTGPSKQLQPQHRRIFKLVNPFATLEAQDLTKLNPGEIPPRERQRLLKSARAAKLRLEELINCLNV